MIPVIFYILKDVQITQGLQHSLRRVIDVGDNGEYYFSNNILEWATQRVKRKSRRTRK